MNAPFFFRKEKAVTLLIVLSIVILAAIAAHLVFRQRLTPRHARPFAVRATPFAQKDIVVGGLRLRYIDEGQGLPLLLIPGHTSRIEEYDRLTEVLRGRYRVLVLDFPGSGYADKPDRRYTLRLYEDTALGFLDALGVRTCFLMGGSLGGNMALRLAHREPSRFPRIVAWAPGSAWRSMPVIAAVMRSYGYLLFRLVSRIQSTYWHAKDWAGREASLRSTFAYYDEVMCRGFVRMYWGIAADQMGTSLFDIAPSIRQPTLLLWGDRDHGLDMGMGVRRLCELMPAATLVVIAGAGHALAAERPDDVLRHAVAFLEGDERAA